MKPVLLAGLTLLVASCLSQYALREEFDSYRKAKDADDNRLYAFVASLACPPSIQLAIANIDDACKAAYQQGGGGGSCSTDVLETEIEAYHKRVRRSILGDLIKMTHDVVYLQSNARDLDSYRKDRLTKLAAMPLLPQTQFRLATSRKDGVDISQQRLEIVTKWLVQHGIPAERIKNPLLYNFFTGKHAFKAADVPTDDRPLPDSLESRVPLESGVWILRMDCP